MHAHIKTRFPFYTFTLFLCINSFLLFNTTAQVNITPVAAPEDSDYTFESIEVEGIDFLEVTASSDFENYAGNTKSADGEKIVGFTLIDGAFTTYDFPGSKNTYFYALGNDGRAAGHYEDSEGHHRGVVLENGELRQYDYPDSVQTEIYGISDMTGALTGNFIDDSGVRRGFSGDLIIEPPGATATFADFVNAEGVIVGSYIDADGVYQAYVRTPDERFALLPLPKTLDIKYLFMHSINDAGVFVLRLDYGRGPRTMAGPFDAMQQLEFPGAVSTEGYNINQDGSVVGYYNTADGHRYGFIAKPISGDRPVVAPARTTYTYESIDVPGVDYLQVTASSDFEDYAGYTRSPDSEKTVGFTLIDGVFTTYNFPGAQETRFYALGNNGQAAGHYKDSDGNYHGVILEDGELRQYDYPDAVQTFLYGYSDATGALTGDFIDAAGVQRGFSGDLIIDIPGATATHTDFVNAEGSIVGSYVDAEGTYHAYVRLRNGSLATIDLPTKGLTLEYFFVHGISDARSIVARAKAVGDVPRTYAGQYVLHELQFPGAVSTEGYNINQDGSVVGHYESADGSVHGFIARPETDTTAQVDTEPVTTPSAAHVNIEPVAAPEGSGYTFESIDVSGIDFLEVTASSEFGDYAGNTRSADGEKTVGFTLIDGVFTLYDFPGSQNTYFYALDNDGRAAGHYEDSDGLYHGVILEDGELRQYNFQDSIQTEIYGISDATGGLTGNYIDAEGVRRGFSGDLIIEPPGAIETYADFASSRGVVGGSYVDADGIYHGYARIPTGDFITTEFPGMANREYFFVHGLTDSAVIVARAKAVRDVPRTYVGAFGALQEVQFPGAVSTEGWNINQDGSIVGYYDTADGRRHGFIARPVTDDEPIIVRGPAGSGYTFESIDVPGVDFLEVTASSDFGDYAGNTKGADGEKIVGFTLIDGVFTTYHFPGSKNTYFYALGNNGQAAGHYEDSDGLFHGVILEDGELRQYDYPDAVQTFLRGISDATGKLTGDFIDASGVRRGFSGDLIVEVPGVLTTYADFVHAQGVIVGSYVDADGTYHAYVRLPNGNFATLALPGAPDLEYFHYHGINDAGFLVGRAKAAEDVPRTYVGVFGELHEVQFPGAVSTEGWNINQDGSIVGYYDTPDGRRHGFIARPVDLEVGDYFGNVYNVTLAKGLNMLSVPLAPPTPMTAKSLVALAGATTILTLDAAKQRFVAWTPGAPDDGFPIEGGKGYIVNVPQARNFAFAGAPWTNPTEAAPAAPTLSTEMPREAWAFVVSGHLEGKPTFDGYQVRVRNLRTNQTISTPVQGDYFAAATADLARRSVVQAGDVVEVRVLGPDGNLESQTRSFKVTPQHLANAVLFVNLDDIGKPDQNLLLQNYPNPFNPETWIPYQLSEDSPVSVSIYDTTGRLVRTLSLGFQSAGFYNSRGRAAYWDGRNELGERVASGVYFYQLTTPTFQQTRRLVILK